MGRSECWRGWQRNGIINSVKLLILADIDAFHWEHGCGQVDAVLSCGDVSDQVLLEAAKTHGEPPIFAVKGNHDDDAPFAAPIVDLHLQVRVLGGLRFGGMNGAWRYKPRGTFLYSQQEAEALLSTFPVVDILVSHNSPRGIHDRDDGVHLGFEGLTKYLARARPKVLVHGHQHRNCETFVEGTRVAGVHGNLVIEI